MNGEVLRQRLVEEIAVDGKSAVARRYGFSETFIGKVIAGAPVSERLAEAMGYRRVVRFEPFRASA